MQREKRKLNTARKNRDRREVATHPLMPTCPGDTCLSLARDEQKGRGMQATPGLPGVEWMTKEEFVQLDSVRRLRA